MAYQIAAAADGGAYVINTETGDVFFTEKRYQHSGSSMGGHYYQVFEHQGCAAEHMPNDDSGV